MNKFQQFLQKWQSGILIGLFCLLYLGQCSTNRTIDKQRKDNLQLTANIDSLKSIVRSYKPITVKDLKIEGLKAEKRMIQSVDRKILDVNRQSEIDKEIEALSQTK
jgi:hypothetical protein